MSRVVPLSMVKFKHSIPASPMGEEFGRISHFSLRLGTCCSDQAWGGLQLPEPAMNILVCASKGAVRQARSRSAAGVRGKLALFLRTLVRTVAVMVPPTI